MPNFDAEEKEILEAFAHGRLQPVSDLPEKLLHHQKIAEATLTEARAINIILSGQDLKALEIRALQEGISMQALLSRLLHQYLDDSGKAKA